MTGIVIIGAGECGVRSAFALRELGHAGTITLVGEEAGLPYERPPLSKDMGGTPKPIRPEESYLEAQIDCLFGKCIDSVDPVGQTVHFAHGDSLAYDRLLLATGARARLLTGMDGCLTLRTDQDAAAISARLTRGTRIGIIGGGFIGLELAATARKAGAEVTVFEAGPRLLGRAVPMEIAKVVHERHEAEGVRITTDAAVSRANGRNVTLADGAKLVFDTLIAGVGAVLNTELAELVGSRWKTGLLWTTISERRIQTSSRPVIVAVSSGAAVACGWKAGERHRIRARMRRPRCWVSRSHSPKCPGSGPISMI